jgi:hypothetical protein
LGSKRAKRVETSEGIENHYLYHADFLCLIKIPFAKNRTLELEFPVKHFNLHPISKAFQVETGPILFVKPDCLSVEKLDVLKELIPGFIHFNSFDWADFSLDFPYGIRGSTKRGEMIVEKVACEIQLWAASSPDALGNDEY